MSLPIGLSQAPGFKEVQNANAAKIHTPEEKTTFEVMKWFKPYLDKASLKQATTSINKFPKGGSNIFLKIFEWVRNHTWGFKACKQRKENFNSGIFQLYSLKNEIENYSLSRAPIGLKIACAYNQIRECSYLKKITKNEIHNEALNILKIEAGTLIKNCQTENAGLKTEELETEEIKPLFKLPPEIIENILTYASAKDITNFQKTCNLARGCIPKSILERLRWEKTTRIPFDSSLSLKQHEEMYAEIGINYPQLINALGGLRAVYDLPITVTSNQSTCNPDEMTAPMMRGKIKNSNYGFIHACCVDVEGEEEYRIALYKGITDIWILKFDYEEYPLWQGMPHEHEILDFIQKMTTYKFIVLNQGADSLADPKEILNPGDLCILDLSEALCSENSSFLFLWDPSKGKDENLKQIKENLLKAR